MTEGDVTQLLGDSVGLEMGLSTPVPQHHQDPDMGMGPDCLQILCVHCAMFILHFISTLRTSITEPTLQIRKGRLRGGKGLTHLAGQGELERSLWELQPQDPADT